MRHTPIAIPILLACMAAGANAPAWAAGNLVTLVEFEVNNGSYPEAGLIADSKGNLYGTTSEGGGNSQDGTVFELSPPADSGTGWTLSTLAKFRGTNGTYPFSTLIADSAGNLYGTTAYGGANNAGTVFELSPPADGGTKWALTTLVSFSKDGANPFTPFTGLIADSAGNFYGTTANGGKDGYGTVFELSPSGAGRITWTVTTLVSFNGKNGASPYAGLIADSAGNLYGTTSFGGTNNDGTVYELSPPTDGGTTWTRRTLFAFNGKNGADPGPGALIADNAGNLYGTTNVGGKNNDGTVYELSPPADGMTKWAHRILLAFNRTHGAYPSGALLLDSAGNLYGTTGLGSKGDGGTVYELSPPTDGGTTWTHKTLTSFSGNRPHGGVIADSAGNLYGTTELGGLTNFGTVFELKPRTAGMARP